jgi:hypothetical protein
MRRNPADRGDAIVQRDRKRMLRRQRVVHADDAQAGPLRKLACHAVIDVDVADHEAAAVQEHDGRRRRRRAGIVEPDTDIAARGLDPALLDMRDRRRAGRDIEWQKPVDQVARALRRAHEDRRLALRAGIDAIQYRCGVRVELRPLVFEKGGEIGHETVLKAGGKSCSNE